MVGKSASRRGRGAQSDRRLAQRPPQRLEQRFLQRAAGIRLAKILVAVRDLRDDRRGADHRVRVPALSAANPPDPLAALANRTLPQGLAVRSRLLSDAARSVLDR